MARSSFQFISVQIAPHVLSGNIVGIHVNVVSLTVGENHISRPDLSAVNRLEAHSVSNVTVKLSDDFVAGVGTNVSLSEHVGNLTVPGLTTYTFRDDRVASDNVHVNPVPVVQVVPPLVVHFHVVETLNGQVAGCCGTAHLAIVDETLIGTAHGIEVLVILIADKDNLGRPFILS